MYTSLSETSETLRHVPEMGKTTGIGPIGVATFFGGAQRFVSLATTAPGTDQRLLCRALQVLHTQPIVSGAALQAERAGTHAEIHVRLEVLSLDEISRVWQALEGSYQLCMSYQVTLADVVSAGDPAHGTLLELVEPEYALRNAQAPFAIPL